MRTRLTLAAVATAATAMLAPAAANASIVTDQSCELQSNTTREIVVPINGLGQAHNVLEPCFGFEITGPGVDLAGANLETFGPVPSGDAELIAQPGVRHSPTGATRSPSPRPC